MERHTRGNALKESSMLIKKQISTHRNPFILLSHLKFSEKPVVVGCELLGDGFELWVPLELQVSD